MFGQKNWLVIFVKPHALMWIFPGTGTPQTMIIPETIISNLEILNHDALYLLIAEWAKARTFNPTEIVWLLASDVYFEAIFPDSEKDKWDSATVQFLDSVPFEEIISRVYTPVDGRQVVATNRDLLISLTQGFAMHGYTTHAVVPSRFVSPEPELTANTARTVMSHLSELARDSLITPDQPISVVSAAEGAPKAKQKSSTLPLLVTVFGVLVVILVAVIFLRK